MEKSKRRSARAVLVYLSDEDADRLAAVCKERGQSRADFLRAAIRVADKVPADKTPRLFGACLERHRARVRREKRRAARTAGRAAERRTERKGKGHAKDHGN